MRLPPLVRKLADWFERRHLRPTAVVVAVSGGADSVALLRALQMLPPELGLSRLVVAHLNHQLRGAESDADERFVADLAPLSGMELHHRSERLDVAGQAENAGMNLEAFAREVRYNWLGRVAVETRCPFVATGHTADDQAETVLHRLLRGTGLQGLCGIASRRPLTDLVELLRPMLDVSREEVLAFLHEIEQPYRTDSSNLDRRFTRNRIRLDLLPALEADYNPAIRRVLAQLSEQAQELYEDLYERAAAALKEAELRQAGTMLVFRRTLLERAAAVVLGELFRQVWDREGWPRGAMGYEHWTRLVRLAHGEETALDLPGGIIARCREHVVQLLPSA